MSRIVAIRYAGKEPVYNLEVDRFHNFITAGGMVLHNCDAIRYFAVSRVLATEYAAVERDRWEDEEDDLTDYDEAMTGGNVDDSYINY